MGTVAPVSKTEQLAENEHPIQDLVSSIQSSTNNPEFGLNKPITNKIHAFIVTSGSHIKVVSHRLYIPQGMSHDIIAKQLIKFGLAH